MGCPVIAPILKNECIGNSLTKINSSFSLLRDNVCDNDTRINVLQNNFTSATNFLSGSVFTLQQQQTVYENLVDVRFDHNTNVPSVIAQGVRPVQASGNSFFPDLTDFGCCQAAAPGFQLANGYGPGNIPRGRHWLTIDFTPQKSNRIIGQLRYPIRSCCGVEDETNVYVIQVQPTIKILTQSQLMNATGGSNGIQVDTQFNMNVVPGTPYKILVTTLCGKQAPRNNTWIATAYTGNAMQMNSVVGQTTQWDSQIFAQTNNPNICAQVHVWVYGLYEF